MARVVKDAQERRDEILDTAQGLFFKGGYAATPISRIIDEIGISKGAFYHHFDSKEALLDGLVSRMVSASLIDIKPIVEGPGDALFKLKAYFAAGRSAKAKSPALMRMLVDVLYRPENLLLRHRLNRGLIAATRPYLAQIITQGAAEGRFDVGDAEGIAEVLLQLSTQLTEHIAELLRADIPADEARTGVVRRGQLINLVMERTLGVEAGAVQLIPPAFIDALFPPAP